MGGSVGASAPAARGYRALPRGAPRGSLDIAGRRPVGSPCAARFAARGGTPMDRSRPRRPRRPLVVLAALGLALAAAPPASASPETLKRSVSNLLFGPLDIIF